MARICIRAGARAYVAEPEENGSVALTLLERGRGPRTHAARLEEDTLRSLPPWLPPAVLEVLLDGIRAAVSPRSEPPSGSEPTPEERPTVRATPRGIERIREP